MAQVAKPAWLAMMLLSMACVPRNAGYDDVRELVSYTGHDVLALANQQVLHEEARVSFSSAATALAISRERLNALIGVTGKDTTWETSERLLDPDGVPRHDVESGAIARLLASPVRHARLVANAACPWAMPSAVVPIGLPN